MGFKKLMASLGAGGASVETELFQGRVERRGGVVQGEVRVQGGFGRAAHPGAVGGAAGPRWRWSGRTSQGNDVEYHQNIEFPHAADRR